MGSEMCIRDRYCAALALALIVNGLLLTCSSPIVSTGIDDAKPISPEVLMTSVETSAASRLRRNMRENSLLG